MNLFLNILSVIVVGFILFGILYAVGRAFITEVFNVNNDRKRIYILLYIGAGILISAIMGGIAYGMTWAFVRVFSILEF